MNNNNGNSPEKYSHKWSLNGKKDDRIINFEQSYSEWLDQFQDEIKPIVLILLDNFQYYSHSQANNLLKQLHEKIINEFALSADNTIYTYLPDKDGVKNSSIEYLIEYCKINYINKDSAITDFAKIVDCLEYIDNIVIIDDCCGTGGSLKNYLDDFNVLLENKKIYYLTIHMMKDTLTLFNDLSKEYNVTIIPINSYLQDKAFSSSIFQSEEYAGNAKNNIVDFSKNAEIKPSYILGYLNSQALMAFYNNTPNNTLGIFWYGTSKYKPIFPRKKRDMPLWKQNSIKKQTRQCINYNITKEK